LGRTATLPRFSDDHPAPRAARIKIIRAPKALANFHHPNGRYRSNRRGFARSKLKCVPPKTARIHRARTHVLDECVA
jgi:hypothetical protein